MGVTIDTTFARQFTPRVQILSQQRESKFARRVRLESVDNAELAFFDTIDAEEDPEEHATRHGETPLGESQWGRRKVTPSKWHKGTLLDEYDVDRMVHDPQGVVTQSFAMSFGRKKDKLIRDAAVADASIGKTGSSSVAFEDESISIDEDGDPTSLGTAAAVGTDTNINLAKMLLMLQIFNEADVDPELPKYWAVSPSSIREMLDLTEVGSADYNTVKALVAGKVDTFMGFEFFWTNLLSTTGTGSDKCYRSLAWAKDGIVLATIGEMETRITERADRQYSTQIYSKMDLGAVRMEGAKVHECLNNATHQSA